MNKSIYTTCLSLYITIKYILFVLQFGRYAALITGFGYGSMRYGQLARKEKVIQEEENAIRARRDARLSAERKAAENGRFHLILTVYFNISLLLTSSKENKCPWTYKCQWT